MYNIKVHVYIRLENFVVDIVLETGQSLKIKLLKIIIDNRNSYIIYANHYNFKHIILSIESKALLDTNICLNYPVQMSVSYTIIQFILIKINNLLATDLQSSSMMVTTEELGSIPTLLVDVSTLNKKSSFPSISKSSIIDTEVQISKEGVDPDGKITESIRD